MFNKLRIKLIIVIISVFAILFASILVSIYVASYNKSNAETNMMLRILCNRRGFAKLDPNDNSQKSQSTTLYQYDPTRFYLVRIGKDNKVIRIANNSDSGYTNKNLGDLALTLITKDTRNGTVNNLTYLITRRKNAVYIAFSNNSFQNEYLKDLFDNILFYGFIGFLFLLVISVYLSKWLIRPIESAFQKQKQFISDASHELKTPVAIISSNADALKREIGESKWLDYIHIETIRMSKLVTDLLELTSVETNENKKLYKRINFSELVMSTVLPFESIAYERQIDLREEIDPNLFVVGDNTRLSQLINILIDNAFHHTEKGGCIKVQLKQMNGRKIMTVSNTGKPIPVAEQKLIFERFYRADKARSREKGSYGLGLAIANSIVKSHNGKITVSCKNDWTTFKIVI